MPDDHKKKLVGLLGDKQIPIIEYDICGDLYFGKYRSNPLQKWDTKNNALYCSSFSKVFAPGLRVGWVVPGRFKEPIKKNEIESFPDIADIKPGTSGQLSQRRNLSSTLEET